MCTESTKTWPLIDSTSALSFDLFLIQVIFNIMFNTLHLSFYLGGGDILLLLAFNWYQHMTEENTQRGLYNSLNPQQCLTGTHHLKTDAVTEFIITFLKLQLYLYCEQFREDSRCNRQFREELLFIYVGSNLFLSEYRNGMSSGYIMFLNQMV